MTALEPGSLLDRRYRVVQVLAKGGFGQTYIAEDTRRPGNPICVVKHLKPASHDTIFLENARRLFAAEAETLERLGSHDQIPRLLAYFEEDQEFYLIQDLIRGQTLNHELHTGHIWTEPQILQMLQDVLNILVFVHSNHVIHRDIKPDNLIRRYDGRLVLVDFGAVKQIRSPQQIALGGDSVTIAVGTPGYMPTEQNLGKPRPNSDLYALGIIGIRAATGLLPSQFGEDVDTGEIIWQPWAQVSQGLADILTRMIRYHFKDRYQSAAEVLQALDALISSRPGFAAEVRSAPVPQEPQSTPIDPRSIPFEPTDSSDLQSVQSTVVSAEQFVPTAAEPIASPESTRLPQETVVNSLPQANRSLPTAAEAGAVLPADQPPLAPTLSDLPDADRSAETFTPHQILEALPKELDVEVPVASPVSEPQLAVAPTAPVVDPVADPMAEPVTEPLVSLQEMQTTTSISESLSTEVDPIPQVDPTPQVEQGATPLDHGEAASRPASGLPTTVVSPKLAVEVPETIAEPREVRSPKSRLPIALPTHSKTLIGAGVAAIVLFLGISNFSKILRPSQEVNSVTLAQSLPCPELPLQILPDAPNYVYPDGTKYYGSLENSKPTDGRVTMLFPTGNRYDGDFENGKRNGCGTFTFANFGTYVGQFQDNELSGRGILKFENGDRYIGSFYEGKCHGQGTFIQANGTTESGDWRNGDLVGSDLSCNSR